MSEHSPIESENKGSQESPDPTESLLAGVLQAFKAQHATELVAANDREPIEVDEGVELRPAEDFGDTIRDLRARGDAEQEAA